MLSITWGKKKKKREIEIRSCGKWGRSHRGRYQLGTFLYKKIHSFFPILSKNHTDEEKYTILQSINRRKSETRCSRERPTAELRRTVSLRLLEEEENKVNTEDREDWLASQRDATYRRSSETLRVYIYLGIYSMHQERNAEEGRSPIASGNGNKCPCAPTFSLCTREKKSEREFSQPWNRKFTGFFRLFLHLPRELCLLYIYTYTFILLSVGLYCYDNTYTAATDGKSESTATVGVLKKWTGERRIQFIRKL